jgi:hypothetical protein
MMSAVDERDVHRVYRNLIGDWCADVAMPGRWVHTAVFDHHPTIALLQMLRNGGAFIADYDIVQGAEGIDVRRRTRAVKGDEGG